MGAERAVVHAQVGDEVTAMVGARVARRPVVPSPAPDEPALRHRVDVDAEPVAAHRALEAELRQRVGTAVTELTAEAQADRHGRTLRPERTHDGLPIRDDNAGEPIRDRSLIPQAQWRAALAPVSRKTRLPAAPAALARLLTVRGVDLALHDERRGR
jgi:hypothetical protein